MIAKFRKNKKRRTGFAPGLIFLFFIGVIALSAIVFFSYTNWKIYQKRAELKARISLLQQEIILLEQNNKELEEKKDQAGSPDFLEEVARDDLGLKRPGEEVVVIQTEENSEEEEIIESKKSWWEKIKSFLRRD